MLLTTENTSIPDVELSDIPDVELSDVFYNGKISSDIWSIKQIDEIINIFLITATEALKILTRNKVQDIDINGLNIIKNEMYFSIHEFANISRFYTETFPDNAIISENIYALHFHYLQKIIPKVLSYESLNKNNLTDIMGAMSEIIGLMETFLHHPLLDKYISRGGQSHPEVIHALKAKLHDIKINFEEDIKNIKNMDFALEGIQKYDDYNKDTYTLFYKRFEDFFSLIGEKGHPNMIKISFQDKPLMLEEKPRKVSSFY